MRVSRGLSAATLLMQFADSSLASWISRATSNAARLAAGLPPARPRTLYSASGTHAAPHARASPSPEDYAYGYIHIYLPDGTFYGHLWGGTPFKDPEHATRFRFVPPSDPWEPFTMAVMYEPTWTSYSAVMSYSINSTFRPGSLDAGSCLASPDYLPPHSSAVPPAYGFETSVWVIDFVTGAVSLRWTNPDGSEVTLYYVEQTYPTNPPEVRYHVVADAPLFIADGAGYSSVVQLTVKFSTILEPEPE